MHNSKIAVLALLLLAPRIPALAQSPAGVSSQPMITLAPGDVVRIAVWREVDLSGDFVVDELGAVTLPLLGRIDLREIPISQLREKLIARYAVDLKNPSITVTPLRRVYVLGEVAKPGLYIVDPTISLAGAVALAGGATPAGDLNRLRVVRGGAVILARVAASSSLGLMNVRSDDQVFVDRRGWFDRNSTVAASAALSVATLTISLLVR
jgi:protein involved in polysaccharide export with SLBB domain